MTSLARAGAPLRLRDLGPLEVEVAGVARPVGGARLESLLALLLVHAGRPVGVDVLCEAVWGEQGVARSASTIDSHIWRLRRVLEPGRGPGEPSTVLVRDPGGYRLVVDEHDVDSARFARLAGTAAHLLADGDPSQALGLARGALGLWRGRPYGSVADQQWARAAVARLDQIHGGLRETYIGALLATGAVDEALAQLETALVDEPLRERLWAFRMTAYHQSGRRAQALQTYLDARTVLDAELGVEPGADLRALHAQLLHDELPPAPGPRQQATTRTLPTPRGRLIGREREVGDVLGLLDAGRLVSVVGVAGCGKTRLAVEVARRGVAGYPDGVWFVDLTAASPGRVRETVASTLELPVTGPTRPAEALRRFVPSRRMLVVLDNCEHVLDDAAVLVEGLLVEGSRLAVLATSREPLAVDGETVVPLDPLTAPAAVELFLDRLEATTPGGERDAETLSTVRSIAAAVDGLPLALELAAGRARAYTLSEIASQIRADASTLSRVGRSRGARHHATARDAVDTSYRDLPAPLAALHRAAAAVPGPFTVELAAGLVGGAATEVVDTVAGLVHRSLLSSFGPRRPEGPSRFAQFAIVRGHAQHRADLAGEHPAGARDAWVEQLVRSRPPLGSVDQARWYQALDDDLAAIRATLQHTLIDDPAVLGVTLAARLAVYWAFNGMTVEGALWSQTAADVCTAVPGPVRPFDRSALHLRLGSSLIVQDRPDAGREHIRIGIAESASVAADERSLMCEELVVATGPLRIVGDAALLAEVTAATRRLAGTSPASDLLVRHAELTHAFVAEPRPQLIAPFTGLHDDAAAHDNFYTAWSAASGAARLLLATDRPADAVGWARAALRASLTAGLRDNPFVLELYGTALGMAGEHVAALRVLGAAEARYRDGQMPWPRSSALAALMASMTARVGGAAAERARAEGARTGPAEFA